MMITADTQMQGESVPASAGDNAKSLVGAYESGGDFIYGSVATDRHNRSLVFSTRTGFTINAYLFIFVCK